MNGSYDPVLVATSIVVAVLASYTALDLTSSITLSRGLPRRIWLWAGSLAMGTGIWSMHFIGMLAFELPGMRIAYDVPRLVLSIVVAIVASAIALHVVTRQRRRLRLRLFVFAGLAMGAAIGGMHYIGMWSMRMDASIEWNWPLVILSLAIAAAASFASLYLAFRFRSERGWNGVVHRLGAGTVMGIAIAGMHYTAMFAAGFIAGDGFAIGGSDVLATAGLAIAVTGSTLLILAIALCGSVVERELTRRAELADERAHLLEEAQRELAQRREVERALRMNQERLRLALDAGRMGIWEWHRESRHIELSPTCAGIHGLDAETFGGTWNDLAKVVHEEDREVIARASRAAIEGEDYQAEYRVIRPDGEVAWVQSRGRYFGDGIGRIIGVCADVTEPRVLEEQLRQSQKMQAIGQLAGGVAHDFNNLLTTIQGNADLLQDTLHDNDPRLTEVREIRRAAAGAASLTSQLLAFGRREMVRPRRLDLAALVQDTESMLRRIIGEEIRLETAIAGPAPVHADPIQIQQILLNLITNARDATPGGGRVTIRVGAVALDRPLPSHDDVLEPGAYTLLSVADYGAGIDPRALEHVFEPFYTTKEPGKGTGLGLSTVYGIVKQAGGQIRMKTGSGVGTTFSLYFPSPDAPAGDAAHAGHAKDAEHAEDAEDAEHAVDAEGGADRAGPTARSIGVRSDGEPPPCVLLVEDDLSVRALTRRMLTRLGYEVMEAGAGEEALELLDRESRRPEILLTDAVMPGMGGLALIDEVRRRHPRLPAVLMSGYTAEAIDAPSDDGAFDFLQKPFTLDELAERLKQLENRAM